MKLTDDAIKAMTLRARNRIAIELDCSVQTVDRWIKENEDNGNMTKTLVVQIISEETGLNQDQILEESDVKEEQN